MDMQELLDNLLKEGLKTGCFPGAVAACGRGREVFAVSWTGRIALDGENVNRQTRYDMASVTKLLSPTMIAFQAIESGKLTLYDTIGMFFENAPEDKREITVFMLMTHRAGFTPSFRLDKVIDDPKDALKAILESELISKPGEKVNYSCMGYIVLGKILEKIYGDTLDALARKMVFEPLDMKHTGYLPKGGNIAATEVDELSGKAWQGIVHDENARFLGGVSANAGVFSDIDDMIKFCQMLSLGGDGYISKAMLNKAICNYTPLDDAHRGLGFHLAGTEYNFMGELFPHEYPYYAFGHTGYTGTSFAVEPQSGFYVILLSNRVHPTRNSEAIFRFRRAMHNSLYANFSKNYL